MKCPWASTLRQIIFDIGGSLKNGATLKAVQIGGPSGGCLTEKHLDEPLDFDSVKKFNAIIGSGGMVVMDEYTCMVEVARFFMSFTQRESCGKCVPCREVTKRMPEILEKIVAGQGELEDLDKLEELAVMVKTMALCGLGKSAPLPVISTLSTFGACRLCTVENDRGQCFASCSEEPRDGMVIYTHTERLRRHCKLIIELLLAAHCRDCTTCMKSGECVLQDLAHKMGVREVRFQNYKEPKPIDDYSPSIVRDPNKCILCGNCARVCSEIQGVGVLGFAHRRTDADVTPAFHKKLRQHRTHLDEVYAALGDPNVRVIAPAVRVAAGEKPPLLTSCCPAWVKCVENDFPAFQKNVPTCRSPPGDVLLHYQGILPPPGEQPGGKENIRGVHHALHRQKSRNQAARQLHQGRAGHGHCADRHGADPDD